MSKRSSTFSLCLSLSLSLYLSLSHSSSPTLTLSLLSVSVCLQISKIFLHDNFIVSYGISPSIHISYHFLSAIITQILKFSSFASLIHSAPFINPPSILHSSHLHVLQVTSLNSEAMASSVDHLSCAYFLSIH